MVPLLLLKIEQAAMNWRDYIHTDPAILAGRPVIKGSRISVELLLERLANGWTEQMIFDSYPHLPKTTLPAVYAFLLDTIRDDVFQIPTMLRRAS